MTHTYNIIGMTCGGCQAKVQALLSKVAGIKNVSINLQKGEASIDMERHIATEDLKAALIRLNPEIAAKPELADEVIYKLRAILISVNQIGLVKANEEFFEAKTVPVSVSVAIKLIEALTK